MQLITEKHSGTTNGSTSTGTTATNGICLNALGLVTPNYKSDSLRKPLAPNGVPCLNGRGPSPDKSDRYKADGHHGNSNGYNLYGGQNGYHMNGGVPGVPQATNYGHCVDSPAYTQHYLAQLPSTSAQTTKLVLDVEDYCYEYHGGELGSNPGGGRQRVVREIFDRRILNRYEVKSLIGKGSFSRVVRAVDRAAGTQCAIKIVNIKRGGPVEPIENELRILARARHPNVIRLHEVFRAKRRVYMVMELANGGELYDRIVARGAFPEWEAGRILRAILDGLSFLHTIGVTHRDIKPENLLFTSPAEDSHIVISDFGLAHLVTSDPTGTTSGPTTYELSPGYRQPDPDAPTMSTTCGTPEYIAPEILLRQRYSSKVDVWAVGVIAYILLSGVMPFDDDNRTRLYISIIRAKYKFFREQWIHTTRASRDFVRSLIEPDPQARLSAHEALNHPWLVGTIAQLHQYQQQQQQQHQEQQQRMFRRTDTSGAKTSVSAAKSKVRSSRSQRSVVSICRSEPHRRVRRSELEKLNRKPEVRHILVNRRPDDRVLDIV